MDEQLNDSDLALSVTAVALTPLRWAACAVWFVGFGIVAVVARGVGAISDLVPGVPAAVITGPSA
ncbi:hypothetical protein [Microbacterium halophytorum]|uniref:hypothetical protein n=1 Tax=Microbacterium halophytorum TaxID=2067568 RepID=UPI000CFD909C|nr:hypothetical protein [Microbacterium halophytorum]